MLKHSFITSDHMDLPWEGIDDVIKLRADHLVCEVLDIMVIHDYDVLPVYSGVKCTGVIYRLDLVRFILATSCRQSLLFHRLNFDLKSAILAIMNNR